MGRERKTLLLLSLTLMVYALSIYFTYRNSLIFPYPINPLIFFILSLKFTFSRVDWRNYLFINLIALLGILTSQFILEIFLPNRILEIISKTFWSDILLLLFNVGLIYWAAIQITRKKFLLSFSISITAIILIIVNLIYPLLFIPLLFYALGAIGSALSNKKFNSYWMLLVILELSRLLTILMN